MLFFIDDLIGDVFFMNKFDLTSSNKFISL